MFHLREKFKQGSFVEIHSTPASMKWGVTVWDKGGTTRMVYPPTGGIVIQIFVDDLQQDYATVLFHGGIVGNVYLGSLKLIE